MIVGGSLLNGNSPHINVSAADNGVTSYCSRGTGLTGAADSKLFSLACWFRLDGSGVGDYAIAIPVYAASGSFTLVLMNAPPKALEIVGVNAGGGLILDINTVGGYSAGGTWHSVLISCDMADPTKRHFWVDDAAPNLTITTYTNDTLDFTGTNAFIFATSGGAAAFDGCLSELWFAPGVYIDFSIEANRRKFVTANNKPAFLGTDGSLPTGTAPIMYHHLDSGEAVANFATNRGTGGNFTVTGSLTTASSFPSDS